VNNAKDLAVSLRAVREAVDGADQVLAQVSQILLRCESLLLEVETNEHHSTTPRPIELGFVAGDDLPKR
jgi:hypothetical protein